MRSKPELTKLNKSESLLSTKLPFWLQLRSVLITIFLLLTIIPLLFVVVVVLSVTHDAANKQVVQQLESVAELKQHEIHNWLKSSRTTLKFLLSEQFVDDKIQLLKSKPVVVETSELQQKKRRLYYDLLQTQPAFDEFFLYTLSGQVIASSDLSRVGQSVKAEPYFEPSLTGSLLQPAYYDKRIEELAIIITEPLVNPETGDSLGVVAGRLSLDELSVIMTERTGLGQTGETYLVSLENNYLVTPSRFDTDGYARLQSYRSLGIDQGLRGQNGSGIYPDYRTPPESVIGVYRWLPELEMALLTELDEAEDLTAFTQTRNFIILVMLIALFTALAVGLITATQISSPILRLTEVATQITQGDLSQRVTVNSRNEIGILGAAFNSMADQLQGFLDSLESRVLMRTEQLETLATLGERFNAILDVDQLMVELVNQVQDKFGYYHVQVYLLQEENLVMVSGVGEVGAQMKAAGHHIPLHAETSLVALAARGPQLVKVDNVRDAANWLPNPLLPDTRCEMAVPITNEGRLLGVLDVQEDEIAALDQGDDHLLRSLASQIGIALENAQLLAERQITIQKLQQIALENAQLLAERQLTIQKLRQTDEAKSRFITMISHELRTPLNAINGFTELLLMGLSGELSEDAKQDIQLIHNNGQHLTSLINDVIDITQIETGQTQISPESIDAATVVRDVLADTSSLTADKPIDIKSQIEADLPHVLADATRLKQILLDLMANALKFTHEGKITVAVERCDDTVNQQELRQPSENRQLSLSNPTSASSVCVTSDHVKFSVSDTGIGIAPEKLEFIFELFEQADMSDSRQYGGLGVGLFICKQLVDLHGGEIGVQSEEGVGSTFWFTMPIEKVTLLQQP